MTLPTSGTSTSGRKILSEKDWKAQAKKDAVEANIMLLKHGMVAKAEQGKPIVLVFSTEDVDRAWGGGDIIRQDGWDLQNYQANPVFLWSHDGFTPAIGRADKVWVEDKKLYGEVAFASEIYPLAKLVEDLYRNDFVRACSVGFNPIKWMFVESRGDWAADYLEQELLECSACNIPCNPNALVAAKSAGIDVRPAKVWAEEILAKVDGPGMYLSRESLERMELSLGTRKIVDLGAAKVREPTGLVPAIKRHRKEAGEDDGAECKEPCCQPATLKADDRVKVGEKLGTVKEMGVGHYCEVEFDDGTTATHPESNCTKTDEPKPDEGDADKFSVADLRKSLGLSA